MKLKDKKLNLLRVLYKYRFDGRYYNVLEILQVFSSSNRDEAYHIAKALYSEGLVKWLGGPDGASAEITAEGVEYVEEQGLSESSYAPSDTFSEAERDEVIRKLNEFAERLTKIEVGQQITYDDLMEELETLKKLLGVLGKKDWSQVLKGKLVDAGFGTLADQVVDLIISTFKGNKFLNN